MFSIDNVIFSIAGQGVSLLELIAVIAGLSCVFLATRGKVLNFWVGYFYNILLFFMFMQKHLYSSMLIQPVSFVINFFGHYRWTHPAENEKDRKEQLKITLLTNKERIKLFGIVLLFTVLWGFFLSRLNIIWPNIFPMAHQPFLDAFV
ncbi:MAG: nicotinamide riboside transporter PnuC, partial [Bacteroidales bacterium]